MPNMNVDRLAPPAARADAIPAAAAPVAGLPEWNLTHLYPAMESLQFAGDFAKAEAECKAFAGAYQGKLAGIVAAPGASKALHAALVRYEKLDDMMRPIKSSSFS